MELGADIAEDTAEHVYDGAADGIHPLDFDVWAYRRDAGWTVVVRQQPPQPMLEWIGQTSTTPVFYSLLVSDDGGVEVLAHGEVDDAAVRVPFETLPEPVRDLVWDHAGSDWCWDGVTYKYDNGRWVAA